MFNSEISALPNLPHSQQASVLQKTWFGKYQFIFKPIIRLTSQSTYIQLSALAKPWSKKASVCTSLASQIWVEYNKSENDFCKSCKSSADFHNKLTVRYVPRKKCAADLLFEYNSLFSITTKKTFFAWRKLRLSKVFQILTWPLGYQN